jgi:hypothetical protein
MGRNIYLINKKKKLSRMREQTIPDRRNMDKCKCKKIPLLIILKFIYK